MPLTAFISRRGRERLDGTCQRVNRDNAKICVSCAPSSQRSSGVFRKNSPRPSAASPNAQVHWVGVALDQQKPACAASVRRGTRSATHLRRLSVVSACSCWPNVLALIVGSTTLARAPLISIGECCDGVVVLWRECCAAVDFGGFLDFVRMCATKKPRRSGAGQSLDQIFDRVQQSGLTRRVGGRHGNRQFIANRRDRRFEHRHLGRQQTIVLGSHDTAQGNGIALHAHVHAAKPAGQPGRLPRRGDACLDHGGLGLWHREPNIDSWLEISLALPAVPVLPPGCP